MVKHGLPIADQTMFTNLHLFLGTMWFQHNQIKKRGKLLLESQCLIAQLDRSQVVSTWPLDWNLVYWLKCQWSRHRNGHAGCTRDGMDQSGEMAVGRKLHIEIKKWISKNRWAHIQKVLLHHLRDPIVGAEKHESNRTWIKLKARIAKAFGIWGILWMQKVKASGRFARTSKSFQTRQILRMKS